MQEETRRFPLARGMDAAKWPPQDAPGQPQTVAFECRQLAATDGRPRSPAAAKDGRRLRPPATGREAAAGAGGECR